MISTQICSPVALIVGVSLLAGSCTVLPAQKDTAQYFILSPVAQTTETAQTDYRRELSIGLGPIRFPGYLKRREMVTRLSDDRLRLSDNMWWAESLDSNFQGVLSQDLASHLQTQRIVLFPWYGQQQIDYQIEVQVHRFDTDTANRSELNARWIIKGGRNGQELFATESNISSTVSPDDTAGTKALGADVNTLSSQMAEAVLHLNEASSTALEQPVSAFKIARSARCAHLADSFARCGSKTRLR
jgi:uncharacterized protein